MSDPTTAPANYVPRDISSLKVRTVEHRILDAIERIEQLLLKRFGDDEDTTNTGGLDLADVIHKIEPTSTPFADKVLRRGRKGK